MISKQLLVDSGCCKSDMAAQWADVLNKTCQKFGIDTPKRVAGFLAQTAHESGGYRRLTENLNYSAEGLANIWPMRFALRNPDGKWLKDERGRHRPNEVAQQLHRNPEMIANNVYANRMGNSDSASGDGWKYRGRGIIQLTGMNNYASFAMHCDNEALIHPELVGQTVLGAEAGGWFWRINELNKFADNMDIHGMTRRINGGLNGIEHREQLWKRLCTLLDIPKI